MRGEQVVYITQMSAMTFPRVHFSTTGSALFLYKNCTYQNHPLAIESCPSGVDMKLCFTYSIPLTLLLSFIFTFSSSKLFGGICPLIFWSLLVFYWIIFSVRSDLMTANPGTNSTNALSSRSVVCNIQTTIPPGPHDDLISMSLEQAQAYGWNSCK
jgi:hypothetical protein